MKCFLASNLSLFIEKLIYTTMKTFKITDLLLQLASVTGLFVYVLLNGTSDWVLPAYFAVGALQMVSMVVHQVVGYAPKGSLRRNYHRIVLGLAVFCAASSGLVFLGNQLDIAAITGIFGTMLFVVLAALLFVAPVMAVAYWAKCFIETKQLFRKSERIFA
jgi:hypothetical protein